MTHQLKTFQRFCLLSLIVVPGAFSQTTPPLAPVTINPLAENSRQITGTVPYTSGAFSVKLDGNPFDCADTSPKPKCLLAATGLFTINLDQSLVAGQIVEVVFTPKGAASLATATARVPGQLAIGNFSQLALTAGGVSISGIAPYPYGVLSVKVNDKEACDTPDKCRVNPGDGMFVAPLSKPLAIGQKVVIALTPNQGAPLVVNMIVQPRTEASGESKTCDPVVEK